MQHRGARRTRERARTRKFEKNNENFPSLLKEIDMQIQEAQKVPNKMDAKRATPRYIIIKMPKIKDTERILKAAREKLVTYKGAPVRLSTDISTETFHVRRDWHEIVQVMKSKDLQPKLFYPEKLSFRNQRTDKELLRQKKY